ncbi:hypothetical protein [Paenibacillus qinlingensis]|uniref:hypothetical protein n=1 Tax=Paenibacillus qinlingensis TaxID=1837343 RepID=UPI0015660885|nr:hypothetical protein [Paenibacillus qinlingensis]NQX62015.1 hypothetical protein [Paenibacillus qinlingensis]
MKVTHYSEQEWMQYVEDHLPSEVRDEMEDHVYRCEVCLANYMTCIEILTAQPTVEVKDTAAYMNRIVARTVGTKPAWYRSTMFHYGIAAAATLVLVATGFFHGLSQEIGTYGAFKPAPPLEAPASLETPISISDHLVNKTLTWLDNIQNEHKKGGLEP